MIGLLWLLFGPTPAIANGQSTHLWITDHAVSHVDNEDLTALLLREDLRPMLRNGTMFPDGGYAVGDHYGELAHWESFQDAYRTWIQESYTPPFTDDGAAHVSFLMGLASHGMADQVFDSLFMERSKQYDTWGEGLTGSLDGASDVLLVHATAPQIAPEVWFPEQPFEDLYQHTHNHEVSAQTMARGQILLGAAIQWVASASQDPAQVSEYRSNYPWASQHLFDETMPGSPPCEGEIIAGYWTHLWELLHDTADPTPRLLATFPEEGTRTHHPLMQDVESRITLVFSNSLSESALEARFFEVTDKKGQRVSVRPYLFYGNDSHVVHLALEEDLDWNAKYTVTVDAGITSTDGSILNEPIAFWFRTTRNPAQGCTGCGIISPNRATIFYGILFAWILLYYRSRSTQVQGLRNQ